MKAAKHLIEGIEGRSNQLIKHSFQGFSQQNPKDDLSVQGQPKQRELLKDRPTRLDMKNFQMFKPNEYFDNLKVKRPTSVLDFNEPRLNPTKAQIQITGFFDNGFQILGGEVPGSVILFQNQYFIWEVGSVDEIQPHSFDILDVIKPRPNHVIIGTGDELIEIEDYKLRHIREVLNIKVDVLRKFEAISTFNFGNDNMYNSVCFLIP